jgi:secretion/DNA translocation related CpaE-like protein
MPPTYAAFPPGPADGPRSPVLVLSRDRTLVDVLQRLAAAAGADLDVRPEPPSLGRWAAPGLVIVGADLVAAVAAALPRRSAVVVVGTEPQEGGTGSAPEAAGTAIWRHAVELGAERVTFLPTEQEWVVGALSESMDGAHRAAVVAVVGGCGGAGASVLAAAVAVTAAGQGHRTLLADLDPLGGGIDLLLGAEDVPGLRWPELVRARGRLSGGMLREALPRVDGLSLLSWDRADAAVTPSVPSEAAAAVADGAVRGFDLVVMDLPRSLDLVATAWLRSVDIGLVLLPASVRGVAAAARVAVPMARTVADLRAVVRGPVGSGLPSALVAQSLGLPLGAELKPEPGLPAAVDRGEPPGVRSRGPLARFATRLLAELPRLGAAA